MTTKTYDEIIERLDELKPPQIAMLMGELRSRMARQPKYRLEEFLVPSGAAPGQGEDWVGALRAEWDDRG